MIKLLQCFGVRTYNICRHEELNKSLEKKTDFVFPSLKGLIAKQSQLRRE